MPWLFTVTHCDIWPAYTYTEKSPRSACPHMEFVYIIFVFLSSKRMKIISCCLREVENADNVIKVSYISAFDSQGRCLKKKRSFLTLIYISSWWWLNENQVTRDERTTSAWPYLSFLCIQKETKYLVSSLNTRISFANTSKNTFTSILRTLKVIIQFLMCVFILMKIHHKSNLTFWRDALFLKKKRIWAANF